MIATMKKNDSSRSPAEYRLSLLVLVFASIFLTYGSHAVAAAARTTSSATIIEPMHIISNAAAGMSATIFTAEKFATSLSTSGPILRAPSFAGTSNSSTTMSATEMGGNMGAGAGSAAASGTVINITARADGTLMISGGSAVTFAVDRQPDGSVSVEYN